MLRIHNFIQLDSSAHVLAYLAFRRLETIVSSSATGDLSLGCVLGQISTSGKVHISKPIANAGCRTAGKFITCLLLIAITHTSSKRLYLHSLGHGSKSSIIFLIRIRASMSLVSLSTHLVTLCRLEHTNTKG